VVNTWNKADSHAIKITVAKYKKQWRKLAYWTSFINIQTHDHFVVLLDFVFSVTAFSALMLLVRQKERHPACKNWVVGCWRGYLGWGADLHIAKQMPLPLTDSCLNKSRLVIPFLVLRFWYLITRVVPDKFQKSSKTIVRVCVWILSKTTRVSWHQKGETRKGK